LDSRADHHEEITDYIRSHNLQDPENKTFIKADERLKEVFGGKDKVSRLK
jgi:chromatin remodeling complex protein RSC6